MVKFNFFIPAGYGERQRHYSDLLDKVGVDNKALIPLAGKPIIHYVIKALDESQYVNSISIAGMPADQLSVDTTKPIHYIEGGVTSFETIKIVSEYFGNKDNPPDYIVNVSADIPLITGQMIDRIFGEIDWSLDKELYWNMVWKTDLERVYPHVTKVPLKLREGHIVAGDIHVFKPSVLDDRHEVLEMMMNTRKSVFGMMKVVSLRYIFKYLIGRLTIEDIDKRFRKLFNLDAAFLITRFPEPCVDLDYVEDLTEFENLIMKAPRELDDDEIVELVYF